MNRLFEIATELGEIARQRFDFRQKLTLYEQQQAAREAALIPEGGWPGSNADTRKAAEKAAKANDPELVGLTLSIQDLNFDLGKLEVDREALIAERDAWQWTIRDMEACAHESGAKQSVFERMAEWEYLQRQQAEIDAAEQLRIQQGITTIPEAEPPF